MCVSLAPSSHCICWWPNTLTPKATHRKPTTWDGRKDQLWLGLTSREHPSRSWLSPGRLIEAYFTSCNSVLVPIVRLEVMPPLPSPSALCPWGPFQIFCKFFRGISLDRWREQRCFSSLSLECLNLSRYQFLSTLGHHCAIPMNTAWIHIKAPPKCLWGVCVFHFTHIG